MQAVPQKDTAPEVRLRRAIFRAGLRYRLHVKALPGSPDIVLGGARIALFVHGCYWHQHQGCRKATTPKSRSDFWTAKFAANKSRDRRKEAELLELGWLPVVVWQCDIDQRLGEVTSRLVELVHARCSSLRSTKR